MKIILFNPAHNGDILLTLEIVKNIIKSNPSHTYDIQLACCSFIYKDLISKNVSVSNYTNIWMFDKNIDLNLSDNYHFTLWLYKNETLYLNMWQILVKDNIDCLNLNDRIPFIHNLFNEIKTTYGIDLSFNVEKYEDLIPVLPDIPDIDISIVNIIKAIDRHKIFIYNLISENYNNYEPLIQNILNKYPYHQIILARESTIRSSRIINLETDLLISPSFDGKNLVIYSNIANECDIVIFSQTGGSIFPLNRKNIANTNTKYYYLNHYLLSTMKNVFHLNCDYSSKVPELQNFSRV